MRPLLGAFHTSIGREFRIMSCLLQCRPKELKGSQSVNSKFNGCLTWIELNVELRASSHSTCLSWLRLLFYSIYRIHTRISVVFRISLMLDPASDIQGGLIKRSTHLSPERWYVHNNLEIYMFPGSNVNGWNPPVRWYFVQFFLWLEQENYSPAQLFFIMRILEWSA